MKRVLVTGANGQLGLALQEAAKESNLEIVFMDKHSLDTVSYTHLTLPTILLV